MHRPQDDVVPLHEPFETALRGFNRQQVLAHIESLEGHISMVTADRESALEQVAEASRTISHLRQESELLTHLREETQKVTEQSERMVHEPIVGASVRIQRIVQLAEEEAAELRTQAEKSAEGIRARATEEATEQRERATSEAEALLRDTSGRCKQLEEDSERRRQAADQAAEEDIARREAESAARIQAREQRSLAALQVIVTLINQQVARRISDAESAESTLAERQSQAREQAAALENFRSTITAQLASTRRTLAEVLEEVAQTTLGEDRIGQVVPTQRDNRPNGENSDQSGGQQIGTVRMVNPGADPQLREDHA